MNGKLHEELFADAEELIPSAADGVKLGKACTLERAILDEALTSYAVQLRNGLSEEDSVARLHELVPEFNRQSHEMNQAC